MSPLTIIFTQKEMGHGNVAQLDAAIECAQMWSPESKLVVITDKPDAYICDTACLNEYYDDADRYSVIYKHTSKLDFSFEFACISRWLIILAYMRRHKIERAFCCDSDVMIFSNIEEERIKWEHCAYTLSTDENCRQAGSSFWSIKALEAFVAFIFSMDGNGGNDMNLSRLFAAKYDGTFKRGETNEIFEGSILDHHLQCGWNVFKHGPVEVNGEPSKIITWDKGQPYAETLEGRKVRMITLHAWGFWKQRMRLLLQQSKDSLK